MRIFLAFISFSLASLVQAQTAETWTAARALALFRSQSVSWGISSAEANSASISSFYKSNKHGVYHAYIQQNIHGYPVMNAVFGLHTNASGKVLHTTNNFVKVSPDSLVLPKSEWSNSQLSQRAAALYGNELLPQEIIVHPPQSSIPYDDQKLHFEKIAYPLNQHWRIGVLISWFSNSASVWRNVVLDVETGNLADQFSWTNTCAHLHAEGEPEGELTRRSNDSSNFAGYSAVYHAYDFPVQSPNHGNSSLHFHPWDSLASPFGWHDVDGMIGPEYTITRGNNVHASEDKDYNNQPGYSPDGDTSLVFNYPYTPGDNDPNNYLDFSITSLFFANNRLHDLLYHYGFDEPSGNFQMNNYGRGGKENDYVKADAQDGSGTNNANFSTPPDGSSGRMQMYIWNRNGGVARFRINSPSAISGNIAYVVAQFGARPGIPSIRGKLIFVNDSSSNPTNGCNPLKNADQLKDNIALIDRGSCNFVTQVGNAQLAGAKAAIVINNVAGSPFAMTGSSTTINIPAIMIGKEDGDRIRDLVLEGNVQAELFDSSSAFKRYDSDLDLGVMAHEYGHGVSNRLTCGPNITNSLNHAEQMGEGWSDFIALAFTAKAGDVGTTPRGIATFVNGQIATAKGIRNYYYSTNMAVNPLTYATLATISQNGYPGPHYIGEIWCTMLWDLYWNLVAKYGYDTDLKNGKGGNNIAIRLVMDGMKLQKCNPGFADARDGILKADSMFNGAANSDLIWKTFARRGLGANASQGSNQSVTDGVAGYLTPEDIKNASTNTPAFQAFKLYPNPASNQLVLEMQNTTQLANLEIIDAMGRTYTTDAKITPYGSAVIAIPHLPAGAYILSWNTPQQRFNARFIKQ